LALHDQRIGHVLSAEQGVFKWLRRQHPGRVSVASPREAVDCTVMNLDGTFTGVEIKYIRDVGHAKFVLGEVLARLKRVFEAGKYSSVLLILVVDDDAMLYGLNEYVNEIEMPVRGVNVTTGYLGDDGEFKPLHSTAPS